MFIEAPQSHNSALAVFITVCVMTPPCIYFHSFFRICSVLAVFFFSKCRSNFSFSLNSSRDFKNTIHAQ